MSKLAIIALASSGCVALSPPPIVPRHASPAPALEGTTSIGLVLGVAMSGLGDLGFGAEVRAMYQASDDTEVGVGIGLGRAEATVEEPDGSRAPHSIGMLSVRAFTSYTPLTTDRVALVGGIGALGTTTHLVALTLDAGVTAGYTNDTLVPYATLVGALSVPLHRGWAFGYEPSEPHTGVFLGALAGVGAPLDQHFLSFEGGLAQDLRKSKVGVASLSIADRYAR